MIILEVTEDKFGKVMKAVSEIGEDVGIYDATQYGNCSYQPRAFYNEEEMLEKVFYYNE